MVGSKGGQGGTPFVECDGVNDCSDSVWPNWSLGGQDPNDQLSLAFDVTAPAGVGGFLFDLAFFSSEYPDFVGKNVPTSIGEEVRVKVREADGEDAVWLVERVEEEGA